MLLLTNLCAPCTPHSPLSSTRSSIITRSHGSHLLSLLLLSIPYIYRFSFLFLLSLHLVHPAFRSPPRIYAPAPRYPPALPRTSSPAPPVSSPAPVLQYTMDRNSYFPRGAADEPISPPRHQRGSASPSRLQKITALSPLQALSPLIPTPAHPRTASETSSVGTGTRSRAGSITKSLSRRQSLIAHAARWGTGDEEEDENYMPGPGLFSKLTLVKAPSEGSGLKR